MPARALASLRSFPRSLPAALAAGVLLAATARAAEPVAGGELAGLTEITGIVVEDAAADGCWPDPEVSKDRVVARLEAAGLPYGRTPRVEVPEFPTWDDPAYDRKKSEWERARAARQLWETSRLYIYVHAFDMGLTVNGSAVPVCVAYVTLRLLNGAERDHHLLGFVKSENPERVEQSLLALTDQFIADWARSH